MLALLKRDLFELKRNLINSWWQDIVYARDDIEGLDSAILTHQKKSLLKIIPVYFFGKGACPNYASVQIITLLYTFYRIRHVRINAYERF